MVVYTVRVVCMGCAHVVHKLCVAWCVPFVGVLDEQAGQQGLGVRRQRSGELDVLHQDELKQLLVVLVVEGQPAAHHLVRHHAQTPPVHRPAVVVVLQDLQTGARSEGVERP